MTDKLELIVFDWDGTLMDSADKIVTCFAAAARDVGITFPGHAAVRNVIGLGLGEAMQSLFPDTGAPLRTALTDRYREHFLRLDTTPMEFFPGVETGLVALVDHGYRLAVATGKARRGLERLFATTDIGHLFAATRCADESISKPHPQMLLDILAQTGIDPRRAIMVGDTVYDMQMAGAAGMASLAVSYGVHARDRLLRCGPLDCLDSFAAVCRWLN